MALTPLYVLLLVGLSAAGCSRSAPPAAPPDERDDLSVTRWSGRTELFAEYPALVTGKVSRFAIHLTRLDTFKPLTDGRVDVRLEGGSAPVETFSVDRPSRPGIFGVDVTPVHAGRRQLVIVVKGNGLSDEHRVDDVDVHATLAAARTASEGGEPAGISFLKEQQWALDFATSVVIEQSVRESVAVPGRLDARPGGASDVVAPIDGRLTRVIEAALGAHIARGQELARLAPLPSDAADLPQLQRARAESQSALALASRDRERAERLATAGAAPAKRVEEARTAEEQARARVAAAAASLAQFSAARSGTAADVEGVFSVRAPIDGVLAARAATTGANVRAGAALFSVVDATHVHVIGQAPASDAARVHVVRNAEIEVAGEPHRRPAGPLVSIGRVLDAQSRSVPITFAFDNTRAAFPVGQAVVVHLLMEPAPLRPTVPSAAIVDDAGRPIVFVQREGESFERRAVTLGPRSGDLVQVTEGVKPGERVVSKGAYLLRLASLSASAPAHGHVH